MNIKKMRKKIISFALFLMSAINMPLFAEQNFSITNPTYNADVTAIGKTAILNLFTAMENDINTELKGFDQTKLLVPMADATALSHKGIGVDYSTNPEFFIMGFAISPSVNAGDRTYNDLKNENIYYETGGGSVPQVGASAQLGLMAGINLGFLEIMPDLGFMDLNKLTIYADIFAMDAGQLMTDLDMQPKDMTIKKAEFFNIGVHGQYPIIESVTIAPFGMAKWGGVSLTSGFEYTSSTILMTTTLPPGKNNDGIFEVTWDGSVDLGADTGILSIPVEVSTNFQFLYAFTLFAGAGLDFNIGKSSTIAEVTAPITGTALVAVPPINAGDTVVTADANLDMSEEVWATPVDIRFFGGLQINFPILKITTMVAYASNNGYQVTAGVKLAY